MDPEEMKSALEDTVKEFLELVRIGSSSHHYLAK
jgi:hypothetical protein